MRSANGSIAAMSGDAVSFQYNNPANGVRRWRWTACSAWIDRTRSPGSIGSVSQTISVCSSPTSSKPCHAHGAVVQSARRV